MTRSLVFRSVDDVERAVSHALDAGASEHLPASDVGDGIVTGSVRTPDGSILGFVVNPRFNLA